MEVSLVRVRGTKRSLEGMERCGNSGWRRRPATSCEAQCGGKPWGLLEGECQERVGEGGSRETCKEAAIIVQAGGEGGLSQMQTAMSADSRCSEWTSLIGIVNKM